MTFQRMAHKTFYKIANAFKVDSSLPYALHRHDDPDRSWSMPHGEAVYLGEQAG